MIRQEGRCQPSGRYSLRPRRWDAPDAPAAVRGLAEPEQADRVVLEDLGPDLRLDVEQLEVAQPAFRGEQRIVGAEQHLVLQVGTGRPDQLRREVLR